MKRKNYKFFGIPLNRIAKNLILSDLVFYSAWGLISPIFAVFIIDIINGGNAFVVGMASGINLVIRSILRIPFGIAADKKAKIAYNFMFWGLLFSALVPIGYIFSNLPIHVYILQALLGAMLAMSTAGWTSLFSRHLEKGKESTEWGVDAVAVGIGPGITSILGGIVVTYFSFNYVFIAVAIAGLIGVSLLLVIKREILKNHALIPKFSPFSYELRRAKKARIN
jgi:predicted MFS family arabinose efflux permease